MYTTEYLMLLFKAEADIQYRLHKVAARLPAADCWNKHKHEMGTCHCYYGKVLNSNCATKQTKKK